ncbi:MCP four helix bundle domain-containing protein [Flavobacterium undicola]|uniref:MCP four helix bundle domain-containing protein n=1 Tax=Flavobacterium undicola TaxID=1932779 RepID=UPI0015E1ECA7|nr:MCP four helix bundle domain-containing protein [Flavobacterium undicola]MBA0882102.1 MCP four helix bundle domain-containing protein [Flavobacterium undicola]
MRDINTINKKTKAAAVLIFVTILLLISNYFIGLNSKKTNESIKAIYNDRLMVSHYIFQYTNAIHQIKIRAIQINPNDSEKQNFVSKRLQSIHRIDKKYLATVLTSEEKKQFKTFQNQCAAIGTMNQNKDWQKLTQWSDQSLQTLEVLAQIQIDEGKTELTTANTLHNGNKIFAQFEMGLFIILGCLSAYLLVLKKMKIKIKIPESPSLN